MALSGDTLDSYTGHEKALPGHDIPAARTSDYFGIRHRPIPPGCVPIMDDDQHVVIGYMGPWVQGVRWTYDIDGRIVSGEEKGLESPLIDPIDLILIVGSLGRILVRSLFRVTEDVAGEMAGRAGARAASRAISASAASMLRQVVRRETERELRFTATTLARMENPGRFVPVTILKLAIRYGVRDADPQGAAGAFRYTIQMFRASKKLGAPAEEYTLRVVLRESDNTVLHFHYSK